VARPLTIGHLRLSPTGEVVEIDAQAAEILGVSVEMAGEGSARAPFLVPLREWIRSPDASDNATAFEHAWDHGEGRAGRAHLIVAPVRDASGGLAGFDVFAEDAEARDEAQAERTRSFLASILETLPNPVFVKDESHRWVLLNGSYCRFMGYDRFQLLLSQERGGSLLGQGRRRLRERRAE
jgi:PAS domain-containing protein